MSALRKLFVGNDTDPDPSRELWDLVEGVAPAESETASAPCHHCKEAGHHNCRLCGFPFCGQCTGRYHLPERFQLKSAKKDDATPQRVCYGCRDGLAIKDPKHSLPVLPSRFFVPTWEVKSSATDCTKCHQKFKSGHQHNCRTCGKSYCSECTSKREVPPAFQKKGKTGPARVCDFCRYAIVKGAVLDEDRTKARLAEEGKLSGDADDTDMRLELRDILHVPQYLEQFREYCLKNHAQENLNFLGAVVVFEDAVSTSQSALLPLANQIYNEFLVQTANQLVNLTSAEFEEIETKMASGNVDSKLFGPACDNVYKMVAKDVFRRFASTPEAKKLVGVTDAETLRDYFTQRHSRLSFSIVQRLEDTDLMKKIETEIRAAPKLLRTIRQGLKSWSDAVEGSALVTYLCKARHAKTRADGLSIAARLIEAGYLHHALDSSLHFYDSETSTNIYQVPQQSDLKKFPAASALLSSPQNVSGFLLLRGIRYNRLWAIASVKDMCLYFWRQDKQPHSVLSLKGVNMVFETGGELEEEESNEGLAFGVRNETEKKKDEGPAKPKLRHGQVYLRVLMPKSSEKSFPEAVETAEYVFLLEDSSMRTRWRKCFEKDCYISVKMMTQQGISKRAAITAQVAVRGVVNDRVEIVTPTAVVAERRNAPPTPKAPPPPDSKPPRPPEENEDVPAPPRPALRPAPPPLDTVGDSPEVHYAMQNKERQAAMAKAAEDAPTPTSAASSPLASSPLASSPSSRNIPVRPSKRSLKPGARDSSVGR